MRYLTRLTDQTVALISKEHSAKLVLADGEDESEEDLGSSGDESDEEDDHTGTLRDRINTFEVLTKNEQEEGVVCHPGWEVRQYESRFCSQCELSSYTSDEPARS